MTYQAIKDPKFNYICGVCGWLYIRKPKDCRCGNDQEFHLLKNGKIQEEV